MLVIGADHGGVELKDALAAELRARGEEVLDVGTSGPASVDYTDYARAVAERVSRGEAARGVLVFGGGMTGKFHARELLRIFLETLFAGGRHQRRVDKIGDIEHEVGLRAAKGALR